MTSITPQALATRLDANAAATEALMAKLLADAPLEHEILRPKRLLEAMRYGSLNGGKRLRPFLAVESAAISTCRARPPCSPAPRSNASTAIR